MNLMLADEGQESMSLMAESLKKRQPLYKITVSVRVEENTNLCKGISSLHWVTFTPIKGATSGNIDEPWNV